MTDKFGYCVNCINFIDVDGESRNGNCKIKPGYITMNAEIRAYCAEREEKND